VISQASPLASASTPELIERFAANAVRLGLPGDRDDPQRLKSGTLERKAVVKDLHAVALELCARNPVAEVLPLYESDKAAVRCFASTLLATVDPEFAEAAFRGLPFDAPTREVVALRRRALTPPPEQPPLAAMSVAALIDRFVDATTRLYATRFLDCIGDPSDMDDRNRIVAEEGEILRDLKARGALERLLPLLDHQNPTVRSQAAIACLAIATEKATAILEATTKSRDPLEMASAKRCLDRWRRGEAVVLGVV
jgi:hypothetical protein